MNNKSMPKLLAFSGKLLAGKDSLGRFLIDNALELFDMVHEDLYSPRPPVVRVYSLISMARDFCVDFLGLEREQVWGTNNQKNTPTCVRWENLPHYPVICKEIMEEVHQEMVSPHYTADELLTRLNARIPTGPMTGRQVLEQLIERIFRPMAPDCVERSCMARIRRENPDLAIITDLRMPTEFDVVKEMGGKVVRLTRMTPEAMANTHISNCALDRDHFDWSAFDCVLDNHYMTLEQTCLHLVHLLHGWGWLKKSGPVCAEHLRIPV